MLPRELFPNIENLDLIELKIVENELILTTCIDFEFSLCPSCKYPSRDKHSYYIRKISDVPWAGIPSRVNLKIRKFFCKNENCPQKIFTERTKGLPSYARRTNRQKNQLRAIGLRTGGNGGSGLCKKIGIKVSASTILRILHQVEPPLFKTPKVLGVDDWAFRKGHVYGTILVDLEKHKPIDLLPDREAETLERWLKNHPGVEIISRDRASTYSQGAKNGAPQAIEIADRWHLLKNLTEALKRMMDKHNKANSDAANAIKQRRREEQIQEIALSNTTMEDSSTLSISPEKSKLLSKFEINFVEVKRLQKQGVSQREIAKELGVSRRTVSKYFKYETYPERAKRISSNSIVDKFDSHIRKRISAGERRAQKLCDEIKQLGYKGSWQSVYRYITQNIPENKSTDKKLPAIKRKLYSAMRLGFLLSKEEGKIKEAETEYLEQLFKNCPEAKLANNLALRFRKMIVNRKADRLAQWIEDAIESGEKVLKNFALGIQRDYDAVYNACSSEWSNGQVEGQVNRLKNIKRQMYGRAGFELLKKMVLADTG